MELNINTIITVKLTQTGANILASTIHKNKIFIPDKFGPQATVSEGFIFREQLWVIMNVFGEHFANGNPPCFVDSVIMVDEDKDKKERGWNFKRVSNPNNYGIANCNNSAMDSINVSKEVQKSVDDIAELCDEGDIALRKFLDQPDEVYSATHYLYIQGFIAGANYQKQKQNELNQKKNDEN